MRLKALRLKNFRSVKGSQEFLFPEGPGLYFMYGDNQAEPRLEGNAAGKTTVWEALTWLIFEKTSRGLKAGSVCNWDVTKGCSVELTYEVEQPAWMQYTCTRTWGPNSWTLSNGFGDTWDLTKGETNPLLAALRLEFSTFLSSILMAQGRDMFLDMKAEPKAALFAEVMGLDKWLEYAKKASDKASETRRWLDRSDSTLSGLQGRLAVMLEAQKTDPVADWEAQRELRLKSIEQEYLGLIRRQKDLEQRLTDRRGEVKVKQVEYDRVEQMVLSAEHHREQRKAEPSRGFADNLPRVCPTCGSAIKATMHGAIELVVQLKAQAKECLLALSDAQTGVRQTERDIAAIDKTLDQLESRSEGIEKEVNPYADRAHRDREFLADLHSQIYSLEQEQRKAEEEESLASSWATWFKEIRLGLISEALDQLELEVNSCITRLGLQDWTLLFDVDKETKSGTLSRGFSVSVLSPHNDKAVPWEAWSGGESQRLRLAANMGLSNLIRQRTNSPLALEVWDEPTQWLSPQGVQDLMEALEQRAEDEHRQIWVLDHRTLGFSGFRGQVGAIKTKEHGTRFDLSGLCLKGSADAPTDANPNGAAAPPELRRRARTA